MKDFTSQQKEVVARKLGYDGPMQGFDEFIASSPSLEAKYAAITGKFSQRMANGGLVKMKPRGFPAGGYVSTVYEDTASTPSFAEADRLVRAGYAKIGRTGIGNAVNQIDQAGYDNFLNLLTSGTVSAADYLSIFADAATRYMADNPDDPYTKYVQGFLGTTPTTTVPPTTAPPTTAPVTTAAPIVTSAPVNPTSTISDAEADRLVRAGYAKIGRTGVGDAVNQIDQAGYNNFFNLLKSGAVSSADYLSIFADAATRYMADNPNDPYTKYTQGFLGTTPTTTVPPTTAPVTTAPVTTAPITTRPVTTVPPTTLPITTAPVTTRPVTTLPVTTLPTTTRAPGVTLSPAEQAAAIFSRNAATQTSSPVTYSAAGVPQAADAAQVKTIATIEPTEVQKIGVEERAGDVSTIEGTTPATATLASVPTTTPAVTMAFSSAATPLKTALDKVSPTDGTLSEAAKVKAEEDTTTALAGSAVNAEQISTAQKVAVVPERTISEAEKVSGTAVTMATVATELAKAKAEEGTVTADMTVQGQLAKLTKDFDAKNPPPWAAGALRAVTAEMSARGLGASSLAGAALVQAAMEKALPIASADAAIYQQVASQNLSNKQQIAVLTAQQRATFLGQEFDQTFQTRVVNAARVSEIANLNFNAKQQVALENAKLAQTVDLANLNSRQAAFMAELAQTATLETASLNNRQQAAVVNAQSALQVDLTNMSYEQQTTVLKAQLTAQAILSDAAAENAAKQFNATSTNQTNQFFATLSSQVSQFNSAQSNGMEQFKVDQANAVKKFNAEVTNQREQFNAQQRLVIDQANAQWQREIATANTAATNLINLQNAQLSQQMTLTEYNNEIQMYRDAVTHAWQSAENDANRATTLAASEISAAAAISGANIKADAQSSSDIGSFIARVLIGR